MNKPDTEIDKFKIIVIQSLRKEDLKTGEQLYDDGLKWKKLFNLKVTSLFYDVSSKKEFVDTIKQINKELQDGEILTLQLETHGCLEGIAFANGDMMNWKEFQNYSRMLNETTGGLLIVCLAMCFGGAVISSIDVTKRAPYKAIVCPFKEVPAQSVIDGFSAFYSDYINMLDLPEAMVRIQKASVDESGNPYFSAMTSEEIFDKTFDPDRDPEHFWQMAFETCKKQTGNVNPKDVALFAQQIRDLLYATKIAKRDFYLFKDLYGKKN